MNLFGNTKTETITNPRPGSPGERIKMMEHTPGKWRIQEDNDGEVWVFGSIEKRAAVCRMLPPRGKFTHGETLEEVDMLPENIANARLIAAAPDLLAACELAAKYVSKMVADDVQTAMPPIIALNRIEAVINRAKGE